MPHTPEVVHFSLSNCFQRCFDMPGVTSSDWISTKHFHCISLSNVHFNSKLEGHSNRLNKKGKHRNPLHISTEIASIPYICWKSVPSPQTPDPSPQTPYPSPQGRDSHQFSVFNFLFQSCFLLVISLSLSLASN